MPLISHSTMSPDFKNFGVWNPILTPAGVPIDMIVSVFNVIYLNMSTFKYGYLKIIFLLN